MSNSLPYDVAILPDPLLAHAALASSKKLQEYDSFFTLNESDCFPHLSLYMLQLKSEHLSTIEEIISTIARVTTPLSLEAYRYNQTRDYIDVEYTKINELVGLQQDIIKALNPIRDGIQESDVEQMKVAEGLALENFQNYGYKYAGNLFRPHMTLSRLKNVMPSALSTLEEVNRFSGSFAQLGLFELGDNGTCIRKIKTFELLV